MCVYVFLRGTKKPTFRIHYDFRKYTLGGLLFGVGALKEVLGLG